MVAAMSDMGAHETSLIMHIPIYTYREAFRAAIKEGMDSKTVSCANGEQAGAGTRGIRIPLVYDTRASAPISKITVFLMRSCRAAVPKPS